MIDACYVKSTIQNSGASPRGADTPPHTGEVLHVLRGYIPVTVYVVVLIKLLPSHTQKELSAVRIRELPRSC